MEQTWTLKAALDWIADDLRRRDIPSPRLEAELLLSAILRTDRLYLYTHFDRPLDEAERGALKSAVSRRRAGESAAVIIGKKEFWSLDFEVTRDVLVPRPDTETLIEAAVARVAAPSRMLDLCCGSGCIAVALATEFPDAAVDAADLSGAALAVAARNVARHNLTHRVSLHEGDLFDALPAGRTYDLIATNPPYVIDAEIETLQGEVRAEPRMALDGGPDGLAIIRRILSSAGAFLRPGGWLMMEMDPRQVAIVARDPGPCCLGVAGEVVSDLAGRERVVCWRLPA
jgi:release factor glutamine methyltransferase